MLREKFSFFSSLLANELVVNLGFEDSSINASDEVTVVVNENANNNSTDPNTLSVNTKAIASTAIASSSGGGGGGGGKSVNFQLNESIELVELKK
jgi:uncharacterized membrane protein